MDCYDKNNHEDLTFYFQLNPYKEENYPLISEWLPEEYAISPGVTDRDDIFQFRDFPWMNEESTDFANLDNWDLFHLMSNGYTLEEAQQLLETQLG